MEATVFLIDDLIVRAEIRVASAACRREEVSHRLSTTCADWHCRNPEVGEREISPETGVDIKRVDGRSSVFSAVELRWVG